MDKTCFQDQQEGQQNRSSQARSLLSFRIGTSGVYLSVRCNDSGLLMLCNGAGKRIPTIPMSQVHNIVLLKRSFQLMVSSSLDKSKTKSEGISALAKHSMGNSVNSICGTMFCRRMKSNKCHCTGVTTLLGM